MKRIEDILNSNVNVNDLYLELKHEVDNAEHFYSKSKKIKKYELLDEIEKNFLQYIAGDMLVVLGYMDIKEYADFLVDKKYTIILDEDSVCNDFLQGAKHLLRYLNKTIEDIVLLKELKIDAKKSYLLFTKDKFIEANNIFLYPYFIPYKDGKMKIFEVNSKTNITLNEIKKTKILYLKYSDKLDIEDIPLYYFKNKSYNIEVLE